MADALAYPFDHAHGVDHQELTRLVGGKGAALAAMTEAGLPVPPGFTLTTAACRRYLAEGWFDELDEAIEQGVAGLEAATGKRLGSTEAPMLLSVRSGAPTSMPGMMDTVLDVGMTPDVEQGLAALTGDATFAADTRIRALVYYAHIVLGAPDELLDRARAAPDPAAASALLAEAGMAPPADPMTQVKHAVRAVFDSWGSARAVRYREVEGIDGSVGTAATVQLMVFGNLGASSGTGVAFTRNPATGENGLMGDFLPTAQGEDVVAGDHVTQDLSEMAARWPDLHQQLQDVAHRLERRYCDMVDIEFTVEQGRLWMLQSRTGKRSPLAAFRMAIDMAVDDDFPVDRAEAVERCRPYLDDPPTVAGSAPAPSGDSATGGAGPGDDPDETGTELATGLGVSPGRASGVLCLDPDEAVRLEAEGLDVVLARRETSPADVHGMAASKAIFTTLGGQVSHAAVVARDWGLPAVVGADEAEVTDGALVARGRRIEVGTVVTVDGDGGRLLLGAVTDQRSIAPEVLTIKRWAAELDGGVAGSAPAPVPAAARAADAGPADGSDLAFAVHHALRIKGAVTTDIVAAMSGADIEAVQPHLDALLASEQAKYMEARDMWMITPDGRTAHEPRLAAAVADLALDRLPYQRFLELNDEFKRLCTDWQLRDGQPNDHSDPAYDDGIRSRLADHDDSSQPVVADIAGVVGWMAPYGARLAAARERFLGGDHKALTGVMCDSYHDIWMELHEDLILTQGIDRAAEGST